MSGPGHHLGVIHAGTLTSAQSTFGSSPSFLTHGHGQQQGHSFYSRQEQQRSASQASALASQQQATVRGVEGRGGDAWNAFQHW
jgi:hypothetical protein